MDMKYHPVMNILLRKGCPIFEKRSLYMTLQSEDKEELKGRHKLGDKSHQQVTATLLESPQIQTNLVSCNLSQ